jgi:subtilisin family serine protease
LALKPDPAYLGRSLMARKLIGVLAFALAAVAPAAAGAEVKVQGADQRFVPGEALVRYASGTDASERRDVRGAADVAFEQSLGLARTQVVSFKGSVRDVVARLEDQPGVAYAQPNYRYQALAAAPNDTHFGQLWGLGSTPGVGVLPAWDRSLGSGQVIAVVDTGVDITHPDLAANLWTKPGSPGIHGHDFVDGDANPDDYNLHGTHVGGTAAAIANNGVGVSGVAPQAQIMGVRVLDGDGGGSSSDIANGIAFAANEGAGVINLSLGGPGGGGDQALSDAITHAETRGAVVVAAAGNENNNNDANPTTPCTLPNANLICVASVTRTGERSGFSNYGATTVDVGAPGGDGSGDPAGDILSAKPAWNAPLFSEDFQSGSDGWTATNVGGGVPWGLAGSGLGGESITDSPGVNYAANTSSRFQKTTAVDLTGQRGCRIDFFLRLVGIEDFVDPNTGDFVDSVGVGVLTGDPNVGIGQNFAGDTGDFFEPFEQAINGVDGRGDVKPTFTFESDATIQGDGAYVDNFNLICRGQTYDDTIASEDALAGHSYTAISGTSMAAPHVAGVAALVRAVDPGAPPSQVVQALKNGAKPVGGMAGVTVTGGAVDAVGAMDAALALPNPEPPPPPPPAALGKPRFGKLSVTGRGVITMLIRGPAGTSGVLTLTANITAARVRSVGRKAFKIGSRGRATVKVKLSRPALKQLRRKRRLAVRAKAVLKNAAGQKSSRTATIRLRLARR